MDQKRRVAQACDACKLRKVKCNGEQRCQQCSHLDLRCIYSNAAKARPKQRTQLKRGRVIAQYRESTNSGVHSHAPANIQPALVSPVSASSESPNSTSTAPAVCDAAFFLGLIPDYNESVYPVNPVLTETDIRESVQLMSTSKEHSSFLHIFAAITINLASSSPDQRPDFWERVETLTQQAIEIRGPFVLDDGPSLRKIMTSIWAHVCLMRFKRTETAFYYLREAISMIQMLRIDSTEAQAALDPQERARRQRMYWEAFVHERFLAIADWRPTILPPLPDLPEFDPTLPAGVHDGFLQIIKLFKLVDGEFLANWLDSKASSTVTSKWVQEKQEQLDDETDEFVQEISTLNDFQQADLIITRQWLRTMVWQMAMSKCLLSSVPSKEYMSLMFPVRLSQRLRSAISRMSREVIEVHGSGILQKLFEITNTIADVVIHVPPTSLEQTATRVDDFLFLLQFLFGFPRFDPMSRDILQKKLETLQTMFPYAQTPPPTALPPPLSPSTMDQQGWVDVAKTMIPYDIGPSAESLMSPVGETFGPFSSTLAPTSYPDERWTDMTRRLSATHYN